MFKNAFHFCLLWTSHQKKSPVQKTAKRLEEEGKREIAPPRGGQEREKREHKTEIDRPWRPLTSMATALLKHALQIIHRRNPIANTSIDDMRKFYGEILCFDIDLQQNAHNWWLTVTASCRQHHSTNRQASHSLAPPQLMPQTRSAHGEKCLESPCFCWCIFLTSEILFFHTATWQQTSWT